MKLVASSLVALVLAFAPAPVLRAQTTTHLGVPSANMVVLSGSGFSGTNSWALWQNGLWTSSTGHFSVPTGKVLVITDLVFQTSAGVGSGIASLTLWQSGFELPAPYQLRFNKTTNFQTYEKSFISGIRVPAGTSLSFSLTLNSGTPSLDAVTVYGYYTN